MSRLERAWGRLNSAMGRTESFTWWRVLLYARDVVYWLIWATDATQRKAHREVNDND